VLDALEQLALEELPRRQLGQVAGDPHGALRQLEELDLLFVLVGAEDEPFWARCKPLV
jgi:hypothetical protein